MADYGSQAVICKAISESFPGDPIVAEEDSADLKNDENRPVLERVVHHVRRFEPDADEFDIGSWIDRGGAAGGTARFWTLDPIDGTKGFLRGEQYAVALALVVEGRVEVAVLGCPNLTFGEEDGIGYYAFAVRGRGAWRCRHGGTLDAKPLRVSPIGETGRARFCESVESGHSAHDESARIATVLGFAGAPRRLDSQAKYAVVAAGEAEVYLRLPTRADYREKIWDHAAGSLLIEEAGGRVSDVDGLALDFSLGRELCENRGVIATNGLLHERVLAALSGGVPGAS